MEKIKNALAVAWDWIKWGYGKALDGVQGWPHIALPLFIVIAAWGWLR